MTSPSGGSSAVVAASHRSFNLAEPAEVLSLLREVHRSTLLSEVKNQIRDEVFMLQQGDTQLSPLTTKHLASIGLTVTTTQSVSETVVKVPSPATADTIPVSLQSTEPTPPQPRIGATSGRRRPAPVFVKKPTVSAAGEPSVSSVEPNGDSGFAQKDESQVMTKETVQSLESVVEASDGNSEQASSAVDTIVPQPAVDSPAPAVSVTATPQSTPNASAKPQVASGETVLELAQSKISQIKRDVNQLVGNPVNLIDADNVVGREYMNALLDAMKKVNTGAADAEIERAVTRLENAHESVQLVMQKPPAKSTETTHTSEPAMSSNTAATMQPEVQNPVPTTPASNSVASTTPAPDATAQPFTPAEPKADELPVAQDVSFESDISQQSDLLHSTEPFVNDSDSVPEPISPETILNVVESVSETDAQPTPTPVSQEETSSVAVMPDALRPVSKDRQIKDLMADQDAKIAAAQAEKMAEKAKDPLYAEDVSAGLQQLLSEWKLFKSSGLFGTGPSGIEHPLYKEISHLTMAAVLAGRYQSANADVKQSITDYMNGWRYEEGIVHEHGETFEHYLRRVIRHILDRSQVA